MSLAYGNFQQMMTGGDSPEVFQDAQQSVDTSGIYDFSTASPPDQIGYYSELGSQIIQRHAQQQTQVQPVDPPQQVGVGDSGNLDFGNQSITADFDPNWLPQRLAAASANGAKISGMGGGMGGMGGMGGGGGK